MRHPRALVLSLLSLVPVFAVVAAVPVTPPDVKRLLNAADARRIDADLRFLADDFMEGRGDRKSTRLNSSH